MNKLMHVFFEVNMANQHHGLAEIASAKKVDIKNLKPGEMVCYVNAPQTALKILASTGEENGHGVIAYYKSPKGRLDLQALRFIPEAFSGSGLNYKEALRKTFEKRGIKEVK